MDIKTEITRLVKKIGSDEALRNKFMSDPVSAVEELLSVDLPNDQTEKIVHGIKAKLAVDDIGEKLGAIGSLFGRK